MFILIVGSGRVGSAVAKRALDAGHEVSVLDSDPLSHERLDKDQLTTWEDAGGRFTVSTALEIDGLIEAGIEQADVFVAATSGDNTNLVIAQIAQRRFKVRRVVVRVADPGRASWYAEQGLLTICPTQVAIDEASRVGAGFVPKADSVIQPGDQVLLILDPGLEAQITPQFAPNGASPQG